MTEEAAGRALIFIISYIMILAVIANVGAALLLWWLRRTGRMD